MLPLAHIPVQPSSQNCLAWSPDGELAVAAGEELHLLIPQNDSPEPWTHLRITASNFTTDEWDWQEQASFKDMAIGEEQARATIISLAWSPSGLAKYRRSVLAVLTSNLILSFWASDSDPTTLDSWKRFVIVNKALSSGSRLQQRIRSMAWTPTNPAHIDRRTPFSQRKWGLHVLAVADDSSGLYILKVSSPFTDQYSAWNVEVLRHHDVLVSRRSNDRPSLLSLEMNAHRFVDHIEFGTWNGDIPIMYRTSGITYYANISLYENKPSQAPSEEFTEKDPFTASIDEARPGQTNMPAQQLVTPFIEARMAAEKSKFGLDNNLGGNTVLKTWGLASYNNMVAACITIRPANMIEYTAPFEGSATIIFDAGTDDGNTKNVFPWQSPTKVDVAMVQGSILDSLLDHNPQRPLVLKDLDLRIIYTAFCGNLLLSDGKQLQRIQAAADMLNLIEYNTSTDILPEHHTLLLIKDDHQLSDMKLTEVISQLTKARGEAESSSCTPEEALLDLCPFCPEGQRTIPFDSLTDAYCQRNHPFGKP